MCNFNNLKKFNPSEIPEFKKYEVMFIDYETDRPWLPKMALYKEKGLTKNAKTYDMLMIYDYPKIKKELVSELNQHINLLKNIELFNLINLNYLDSGQICNGYKKHYKLSDFFELCKNKLGKEKAEMLATLIFYTKIDCECFVHSWDIGKYYYRLGIVFDPKSTELFKDLLKDLDRYSKMLNKDQLSHIKKKHYNYLNIACKGDESANTSPWFDFDEESVFFQDYKIFRTIMDIDVISIWLGFHKELPVYKTEPEITELKRGN